MQTLTNMPLFLFRRSSENSLSRMRESEGEGVKKDKFLARRHRQGRAALGNFLSKDGIVLHRSNSHVTHDSCSSLLHP
jgi:hypothetical protein